MLSFVFVVPLLVCPAMGADMAQTGQVVCTMFFVSGLNTLVSETIFNMTHMTYDARG